MRRARLALLLPLVSTLPAACDIGTEDTRSKCHDQAVVYALDPAGAACGRRQVLEFSHCERLPEQSCKTQDPAIVCVGMAGDVGLLVELSPCATMESLPVGWGLGDELDTGPNAARECANIRDLCDGGTLPYTPREGVLPARRRDDDAGAGGSAGAGGDAGAGGASGTSGAAGTGGKSGAAGTGGKSGAAGTGGKSGAAGTGGKSGAAGTGGAAGVGGGAGTGGKGGAAGISGAAGAGAGGAAGISGAAGAGG